MFNEEIDSDTKVTSSQIYKWISAKLEGIHFPMAHLYL